MVGIWTWFPPPLVLVSAAREGIGRRVRREVRRNVVSIVGRLRKWFSIFVLWCEGVSEWAGGVVEEEVGLVIERRCRVLFKYTSGKAKQPMRLREREPK